MQTFQNLKRNFSNLLMVLSSKNTITCITYTISKLLLHTLLDQRHQKSGKRELAKKNWSSDDYLTSEF